MEAALRARRIPIYCPSLDDVAADEAAFWNLSACSVIIDGGDTSPPARYQPL